MSHGPNMIPVFDTAETVAFLHHQIPISRAMGVAVEAADDGTFVLTAPLAKNHNHLGTAFGGSLSAIATLAGYGMLWVRLGDPGAHIVIKSSGIRYLHPVRQDIRAVCENPEVEMMESFLTTFSRKERARIRLTVRISGEGRTCVEFTGEYVALR